MDKLGKLLFPKSPKMVRFRKLQILFFSLFLLIFCWALAGVMFYLMSTSRH